MPKYISGRFKKTPQSALPADRYRYLSVGDAEPNLGDSPSQTGSPNLPSGQQYMVVGFIDKPGERFWIPVQGGIIPGSISVFEEGTLVGGLSSTTQLDFRGNAITAEGIQTPQPGVAVTITVAPPGNENEILFVGTGGTDFDTDLKFTFDSGLLAAGDRITVGTGGTVITTTVDGFVGIGTTIPTQKLHLNDGNFRITGTIYDSLNQPGSTGDLIVKTATGGLLWVNPNSVQSGAGGTIGQIQFHNTAGLVDGADNFYFDFNNNRVGIGSTIPTQLLDVLGVSRFAGDVNFIGDNYNLLWDKSQDSLEFKDETKATFGNGRDLQILHTDSLSNQTDSNGDSIVDGRTSLIEESGSGGLIFKSNGGDGPGAYQFFDQSWQPLLKLHGGTNARALLFHDGIERIETTGYGVTINGGLTVSGIVTISTLDLTNLNVSGISSLGNIRIDGVSDPNKLTTLSGNLIIDSQGQRTQVKDILFVDNNTESTNKDNGAIYTQGGVGIERNLNVGGAVSFTGPSVGVAVTLAAAGGITTTGGDLYVGGDLHVKDDIFYDELSGQDMIISGIATINQLEIGQPDQTLVGITTILDEDDMISDRDDALATQQSIKKYVDDQVSAVDLDFEGDSGTGSVDLDSQTFKIEGTTNEIETSASNEKLTIGLPNDVTVSGNLTVNGNTTLGNANTDNVVFNAEVDSNIIPDDNQTYNLGSTSKKWNTVFATTFNGAFQGTADITKKLETPRTFTLGEGNNDDIVAIAKTFDGTQNVGFALTLKDVGPGAGTYGGDNKLISLALDDKGRVTGVTSTSIDFGIANVATADSLTNSRTITATGDIEWSVDFKGHENVSGVATLSDTTVSDGNYGSGTKVATFSVDTDGRLTAASDVDIDFGNATVSKAGYADNAGIATNLKGGQAYNIPYQSGANETLFIANGSAPGQLLQYNQNSAPSWVSPTNLTVSIAGYADNAGIATNLKGGGAYKIPYQSAANTTQFIANGSAPGQLLQYNQNSAPSWVSPTNLIVDKASFATIAGYSTNSGIATIATYTSEWEVTGGSSYNFTGPGNLSGTANPTIYLTRGQKYKFKINASSHPFWIKTSDTTGTGNQYNTGVTNNGTESGTILFDVPMDAPNTLYYICQYHGYMKGTIYILDQSDANDNTTYDLSTNDAGAGNVNIRLTGSDSTTDDVLVTAGANITLTEDGNGNGFTIASSGGGTGTLTDLDVKQFSNENTPRTEYGCSNPIDVTISAGIATIGIGSTSNAFGKRYVGTTEPTTDVCDGDIWYDTTPSSGGGSGGFVTGMIMMFSGTTAPSGWVLCDNSAAAQAANAPDLRDRFIVGASNISGTGTYPGVGVGSTGGSADAVLVAHNHDVGTLAGTTDNPGDHTHGSTNGGIIPKNSSGTNGFARGHNYHPPMQNPDSSTTGAGGHTHGVTFSGSIATKGLTPAGVESSTQTGTNANLPPYYALAFIMKT